MCEGTPPDIHHERFRDPSLTAPLGIGYLSLSRLHSVRIRRVIEVVVAEGEGVVPDDPVRDVRYYYDLEGNYLGHHDRYDRVKPWLKLDKKRDPWGQ